MNLIISPGISEINEIAEISKVSNSLISHVTSSPAIGQFHDSIIGMASFTQSDVHYLKYNAMRLFQNTRDLPDFSDMEPGSTISGRECISKILAATPINFTRNASWYKPAFAQYIKYDPTEIKVKIDHGKLTQGILDKASIGNGANGGIYHIIANEYGNAVALNSIYEMQQVAIAHILQCGFSIGIMDMIMPQHTTAEIANIAADNVNKSNLITEELCDGELVPPIGQTVEQFYEERQINTLSIFDDFIDPVMRHVGANAKINNLYMLFASGSKGSLDNLLNMVSSIGQKLINGERIRQKFGPKRTMPYFPRFDTSPQARGYIANSYMSGMDAAEYTANAQNARFDLISKALSTSVTGEQNRKSIKNLESDIANNLRMVVKGTSSRGTAIIQFAYGDDFLDPRRVERVHFPTVMISDADFEATYLDPAFTPQFETMRADRVKYRTIFMQFERMNVKELMSDERHMPVNVERIVRDITRAYGTTTKPDSKSTTDIKQLVDTVEALCTGIPYVLMNEIQEKRKTRIPDRILECSWLLTMLIRSYLHPRRLAELSAQGLNAQILKLIVDKIRLRYAQALIAPGTAVGIIAAQSFSEPLTQYMLDAHHRSAAGGTSKSGMTRCKEVLGAKDVAKMDAPIMLIPVISAIAGDKARVQEIANTIEMMTFRQFVSSVHIFFEKYADIVHPAFISENKIITDFVKMNPLLHPSGDLARWCIRFAVNKSSLILKNMALEVIITKLRDVFPECFIVYTPENTPLDAIVIRVYMANSMFKGIVNTNTVRAVSTAMLDTIIRGLNGIRNTKVVKMIRNRIDADGKVVRDDDSWGITTIGTNLAGIFAVGKSMNIDVLNVRTNAIQEMSRIFGIEAARNCVISELRALVPNINHRHYTIYADEMTNNGRVTSIESSGLKSREASNIILRIGFSSPLQTIREAAIDAMQDTIGGITPPLLVGSTPHHGTFYNTFHVNGAFVRENVKRPDDLLDALLA